MRKDWCLIDHRTHLGTKARTLAEKRKPWAPGVSQKRYEGEKHTHQGMAEDRLKPIKNDLHN